MEGNSNIPLSINATIDIDRNGKVTNIHSLTVSPEKFSTSMIRKLIKEAEFKPASINGEPDSIRNYSLNLEFEVQPKSQINLDLNFDISGD